MTNTSSKAPKLLQSSYLKKIEGDGFSVYQNVAREDVMILTERNDIAHSNDGQFTQLQFKTEEKNLDISWHQDGTSKKYPPATVLLYCESAGKGEIMTEIADSALALANLDEQTRNILTKVTRYNDSRFGLETYSGNLVGKHIQTGSNFLSLPPRGWLRGDPELTLEEIVRAAYSLYEALKPCYSHSWSKGDLLLFNNVQFLHRRFSVSRRTDPDRKMIRMWFDSELY
jgi:alpha-ketoglutarate-dependent taurine dioxygenase